MDSMTGHTALGCVPHGERVPYTIPRGQTEEPGCTCPVTYADPAADPTRLTDDEEQEVLDVLGWDWEEAPEVPTPSEAAAELLALIEELIRRRAAATPADGETLAVRLRRLAAMNATAAHARGDADERRRWLDFVALIDREETPDA